MRSDISDPDFEQLVRRTLADVAATSPESTTDPDVARRSKIGSTWLLVAAALLVVAGIGALVVTQRQADTPPAAQHASRIDPVAHLFVLPNDSEGLVLSNGSVSTVHPDETEGLAQERVGFLMGIELRDGAYSDLVQVTASDALPDGFGTDGVTEIDTPTGPAVVDSSFMYRLAQERGDVWLLLTAQEGTPRLVDALGQITISSEGQAVLDDGPMTVIEAFERSSNTVDYTTYYEVTDVATGTMFVVETATSSSVVALGASTFDAAQPTTVNGTPAWIATRDGDPPNGVNAAVVWQATPNRIVAISAHAHTDVVTAMAERLQEVSVERWTTALPEATIED